MPSYYCIDCGRQREFLNVKRAAEMAQVTRATVYNWLKKAPLHVIVHPSGRKYICTDSILTVGVPDNPDAIAFANGFDSGPCRFFWRYYANNTHLKQSDKHCLPHTLGDSFSKSSPADVVISLDPARHVLLLP